MPSTPEPFACEVVEGDDGTYAVVCAGTGRIVEVDGTVQRGLTIDQADNVADRLEALDRVEVERGGQRMDG